MNSSTHNHSTGSDGRLTPEEVIKKAIELGWKYLYFTDHYFCPKETEIDKEGKNYFVQEYMEHLTKHIIKQKHNIICLDIIFFNSMDDIIEFISKIDASIIIIYSLELHNCPKIIIPGKQIIYQYNYYEVSTNCSDLATLK